MARHLGKISGFNYTYEVATLSWVPWDGVLNTGTVLIGAVSQSGTWTVQPGNTANTTPWLVDGPSRTADSSTNATGSTSSAEVVAAADRSRAELVNEGTVRVYVGVGAPAVVGRGPIIFPNGGTWFEDELSRSTQAINIISSAAGANVGIQVFR